MKNSKKWKNNFLAIIERYNLAKFHVSSNYSSLSLLQNVYWRKSHFYDKAIFLPKAAQNYKILTLHELLTILIDQLINTK